MVKLHNVAKEFVKIGLRKINRCALVEFDLTNVVATNDKVAHALELLLAHLLQLLQGWLRPVFTRLGVLSRLSVDR